MYIYNMYMYIEILYRIKKNGSTVHLYISEDILHHGIVKSWIQNSWILWIFFSSLKNHIKSYKHQNLVCFKWILNGY